MFKNTKNGHFGHKKGIWDILTKPKRPKKLAIHLRMPILIIDAH